jgi:arylsulfatase A-like enzyme
VDAVLRRRAGLHAEPRGADDRPLSDSQRHDQRKRVVLFPDSGGGCRPRRVTLAELLKQKDYATGIFGKWHLGHLPQYLPTSQGFDTYFGIPYSNDMDKVGGPNYRAEAVKDPDYYPEIEHYNVPLMRDEKIIERPADQNTITKRYTEEAVKFIRANKDQPFFVYLPHSMPHIPLFVSQPFRGKSIRGLVRRRDRGDRLERRPGARHAARAGTRQATRSWSSPRTTGRG